MRFCKWATAAVDYAWIVGLLLVFDQQMGQGELTPWRAFLSVWVLAASAIANEYVKGPVLFPDIIAPVKRDHLLAVAKGARQLISPAGARQVRSFLGGVLKGEGWLQPFSDHEAERAGALHHIWYFVKSVGFVAGIACIAVWLGLVHWTSLGDERTLVVVYVEFLVMSFLRDSVPMHVLHRLMHERWFAMHSTHHLSRLETAAISAYQFDYADLFTENVCAPFLLLGVKAVLFSGYGVPQLHLASVLIMLFSDITLHSCNPCTVTFFNPLLDLLMKGTLSHSLHHAKMTGHYAVFPWHHLSENGLDQDVAQYNALMKTEISFG